MSRNNIIMAAIGGAIVGVIVANFASTEKGKQMVDSASGLLKDLAGKATDYAKNNFENMQFGKERQS